MISKTEECVEKEITIQDLTKELVNLKKTANKRPTFEIEESIKLYKQELSKQYEKMKSVIAERNMFENQVEDFKADNNKLKKDNTEMQMKYHEVKLRQNRKTVSNEEFKRSTNTAIVAAFSFLIGLVWRDLITEYIDKITSLTPLHGKIITALIVTFIAVIGITVSAKVFSHKAQN